MKKNWRKKDETATERKERKSFSSAVVCFLLTPPRACVPSPPDTLFQRHLLKDLLASGGALHLQCNNQKHMKE